MKLSKRLFAASVIAFSSSVFAAGSNTTNVDPGIVGKSYLYDYGDYAYDITVTSKSSLHWQLVKGNFEGPDNGNNPYIASKISDGIIFLSWKEESGYRFFNVMNLNTGTLTTHAETDEMSLNRGKVSLKK